MSKLIRVLKNRKSSKSNKRFLSSRDMSELKHMISIRNSQIKRKEIKENNNAYVSLCGCGHEGCFILGSFESVTYNFYR